VKRFLSGVVLVGLMLHGLSQAGAISYLYQQRHALAFNLGLIAERSIPLCKSDYFQQTTLSQILSGELVPTGLAPAPEIGLDVPSPVLLTPSPTVENAPLPATACALIDYNVLQSLIFHPPLG
jgi:hypothetical protein